MVKLYFSGRIRWPRAFDFSAHKANRQGGTEGQNLCLPASLRLFGCSCPCRMADNAVPTQLIIAIGKAEMTFT